MAGEDAPDLSKHLPERHGRAADEEAAGCVCRGEGGGLILGGDGREHGGFAPPDAPVPQLHPEGDVPHGFQPRGRDGEGGNEGDIEGPALGPADVYGEGLIEAVEAEAHRDRSRRPPSGGEGDEIPRSVLRVVVGDSFEEGGVGGVERGRGELIHFEGGTGEEG